MKQEAPTTFARSHGWERFALQPLARIGRFARSQPSELRHLAAVIGTVGFRALRWGYWTGSNRSAFGRQLLHLGVEPILFVGALGGFIGISLVVQLAFWTGRAGQAEMLGPLLVAVVARELGPLLINLVVIVRSGSAMTTELGLLKTTGQVSALEASGGDAFDQIVVPRVLALAISTFCLTIVFIVVAFISGFVFAAWTGKASGDFLLFANSVAAAIQPRDVLNILAKSVPPAAFAAACCCVGALSVGDLTGDVPRATQRALTRSVAGLFVISVTVSVLTYL